MIDVLLVLLIIFMAIAPTRSSGLDAAVPRNSTESAQSERDNPVVLEIASDGSYSLNSQAVAKHTLRERLIEVFARRGVRVLFVKAAAGLEFGVVADAIDVAHGVNVDRIALMPRLRVGHPPRLTSPEQNQPKQKTRHHVHRISRTIAPTFSTTSPPHPPHPPNRHALLQPGEHPSMSSTANVIQIEANRRNSQQSTGPRSDAGKQKSSLNALRHGLTARVVVLPTEDLAAYQRFSAEFLAALAPETFVERQYAQTIIDTQWRLNRVRGLEDGMLALGHYGPEGQPDEAMNRSGLIPETCGDEEQHPEIHAALTAAAAYREHSRAFLNLSMHEQRLYRVLRDATKTLEDLKARRTAARQADLDAAVALHNMNKMLGEPNSTTNVTAANGFVFTPEQIQIESRRHRNLFESKIAEECHYDRKRFRQQIFANSSSRASRLCVTLQSHGSGQRKGRVPLIWSGRLTLSAAEINPRLCRTSLAFSGSRSAWNAPASHNSGQSMNSQSPWQATSRAPGNACLSWRTASSQEHPEPNASRWKSTVWGERRPRAGRRPPAPPSQTLPRPPVKPAGPGGPIPASR